MSDILKLNLNKIYSVDELLPILLIVIHFNGKILVRNKVIGILDCHKNKNYY